MESTFELRKQDSPRGHELTKKEKKVLEALRGGLNGPEVADAMGISVNTVKFHRKNAYSKLGVGTLRAAIRELSARGHA